MLYFAYGSEGFVPNFLFASLIEKAEPCLVMNRARGVNDACDIFRIESVGGLRLGDCGLATVFWQPGNSATLWLTS